MKKLNFIYKNKIKNTSTYKKLQIIKYLIFKINK